jgi:phage tail-like protein
MDANGLPFWSVASSADWALGRASRGLYHCQHEGLLRLAGAGQFQEDSVDALARAQTPSAVVDQSGVLLHWQAGKSAVIASADGLDDKIMTGTPSDATQPRDLALDEDSILYVCRADGAIELVDTRGRWAVPRLVSHTSLKAARLAPRSGGGVWLLDTSTGHVGALTGRPLRDGARALNAGVFQREETNINPPQIRRMTTAPLPAGWKAIAVAARGARVAVLAWSNEEGQPAAVFVLEAGRLKLALRTKGLSAPYDMAWIEDDRVAFLVTGNTLAPEQIPVFDVPPLGAVAAQGKHALAPAKVLLARRRPVAEGFINAPMDTLSYAVEHGPGVLRALPLRAISGSVLEREGEVLLGPFDAGNFGAVWHRLYLEAVIPDHGIIRVDLHADDVSIQQPENPHWHPHLFGNADALRWPGTDWENARTADTPRAAWLDMASEIPHHPGLLHHPRAKNQSGLFSVLAQRAGHAVRRVQGRYLWLRLTLGGDTRMTPAVAGLRIYAGRFAYRDKYLPALYHEEVYGEAAHAKTMATPPDFLDRFLGMFEEPLTIVEGRVAEAYLLTDPASVPGDALAWLGRWIGIDLPAGGVSAKERQSLLAAPFTARLRGTLGGLAAELELATGGVVVRGGTVKVGAAPARAGTPALAEIDGFATDVLVLAASDGRAGSLPAVLTGGGVTGGEIVIIEGFRLQRTMATILGADLADELDPLTAGLVSSGNSYVGDTLILGDETRREFLALFGDQALTTSKDREAVAAAYAALAHTVLVLVHGPLAADRIGWLEHTAREHAPAHVQVKVHAASLPLHVGVASLVGIDTYLGQRAKPLTVRQNTSVIGAGDRLDGAGLRSDMQLSAAALKAMQAGRSFTLSGARGLAPDLIWQWQ